MTEPIINENQLKETDPIIINENHLKEIINSLLSELNSDGIDPRDQPLFMAKNAAIMYSERTGLKAALGNSEITSYEVIFPVMMALIEARNDLNS